MIDYKNKCTVIVNSCDSFSDVWELFFKSFNQQWENCEYPIILNTESKKYLNYDGIRVINFKKSLFNNSWAIRFKRVLSKVDTPYIIPILDDFVLKDKFNGVELIHKCIDWLDRHSNIGVFYLHKHPNVINEITEFENFGRMPDKCEYKLTTAFGIWRKSYLNKSLLGIESPWEWEVNRTKRAWRYKEVEYSLLNDEPPIYNFPFGGVIWRGLWHPEAVDLAKKYNVSIDFSIRGMMDQNDPYRTKNNNKYSIIKNFPKDINKAIFWKELYNRVFNKFKKVIIEIW